VFPKPFICLLKRDCLTANKSSKTKRKEREEKQREIKGREREIGFSFVGSTFFGKLIV
jgi:hypothetical protein